MKNLLSIFALMLMLPTTLLSSCKQEEEKPLLEKAIKRNDIIIEQSDMIYVFWDGKSHGTLYVIKEMKKYL